MSMRMAGAALAGGTALGAGGLALAQHLAEQAMPAHAREMTQEDHAARNLRGLREAGSGASVTELGLYEGIRQGLMAGEITGEEVYALAQGGQLPQRVVELLQDAIDLGAYMPVPGS
jgi:predicted O-methyltransferase YrrM